MKYLAAAALSIALCSTGFTQTFKRIGKFGITIGDKIEAVEFAEKSKKLLLVGNFTATVWDIDSNQMVDKVVFGKNDELNFAALNGAKTRVLSADILVRSNPDEIRPGSVYDLRSGRRIHEFDRRVAGGFWSANDRTLITANRIELKPEIFAGGESTEISFWDGENFSLRKTIAFDRLFSVFLTADGRWLYVHSADAAKNSKLEVYDANSGLIATTLFASSPSRIMRNSPLFSSTGRFAGAVVTDRAAGDERRLLIWETNASEQPFRQITVNPSISSSEFLFSPDEKFVAVDSGKSIKIVDLSASKTTATVNNSTLPLFWIAGNDLFLYGETGFRVSDNRTAYRYETVYETIEEELPGGSKETRVIDFSTRIPSSDGDMFLTFSEEKLTIFDARSGKILSELVEPQISKTKGVLEKIREVVLLKNRKVLVSKANWSDDGKIVYAIDGELGTATLWRIE